VADLDRDGWYDVILYNHQSAFWYWATGGTGFKRDRSYLRRGDFHGAAALDIDGDGFKDVLQTRGGGRGFNPKTEMVFRILQKRKIRKVRERRNKYGLFRRGMRGRGVFCLDMDGDGDDDILFVSRELPNGQRHIVYENLGNGRFRPRYNTGLGNIVARYAMLTDVNDDGYMDVLFMGYSRVFLLVHVGPFKFKDQSWRIPFADRLMQVQAGAELDFDNDGDFDVILTRGRKHDERKPLYMDALLENRKGVYKLRTNKAIGKYRENHMGVTVGDFDNDGFVDIFISRHSPTSKKRIADIFLINQQNKRFVRRRGNGGLPIRNGREGNAGQAFDYDMDGRIDLLVGSSKGRWQMFRNVLPRANRHYLLVRVGRPRVGRTNRRRDRSPLGAKVVVFAGRLRVIRRVGSAGESRTQCYLDTLHFGLGPQRIVNRVVIQYVNGVREVKKGPFLSDRTITVGRV